MNDQESDKFNKELKKIINDLKELIMSNHKLPEGCDIDPKFPCCATALALVLKYMLGNFLLKDLIVVIYKFINAIGENSGFSDSVKFHYYNELFECLEYEKELQKNKIIKDKLERLNSNLDKSDVVH
jgi:hypothetical protein